MAGLAKALRAQVRAVRLFREVNASLAEDVEKVAHVLVPAVGKHSRSPAVKGLGVKFNQVFYAVVGHARFIEDGHVVVVAAADATGAFELTLIHDDDIESQVAGAERSTAAGGAGPDDKHVGFNQSAEGMCYCFHMHKSYLGNVGGQSLPDRRATSRRGWQFMCGIKILLG